MCKSTHLRALLSLEYGLTEVEITSLHRFEQSGRGVFRVDVPGQASYVLRVQRQELVSVPHVNNNIATLHFLEQVNFPAPHIRRTRTDALIGYYQGWSTLLLSYIEGELVTGTAEEFRLLGAMLAQLHLLDITTVGDTQPSLPPCRWQPMQRIADWQVALARVHDKIPDELHGLALFSVNLLSQVLHWPVLPVALLHGDPNSFNTIRTMSNELILIDWDGAGTGPPILDLGYLLLTAHAVLPTWPAIEPNTEIINAILTGYCTVRPLTEIENRLLPTAICLNDAVWAAKTLPHVIGRDWREIRTLTRFGSRYPSLAHIGQVAQQQVWDSQSPTPFVSR